jgi:hypothetical protein
MTIKDLPFIAPFVIDGEEGETGYAPLDNFRVFGAAFYAPSNGLTVKAAAKRDEDDAEGVPVPFFIKRLEDFEKNEAYAEVPKEGVKLVGGGQYTAVVTADSLASGKFSRASFNFSVDDGEVGAVALFLTDPRYSDVLSYE